jgi:hypothetical protein
MIGAIVTFLIVYLIVRSRIFWACVLIGLIYSAA